ncbi:MAG: hypothetical protein JSU74_13490 [Candidatus Zixiibacteriota bacterium]|nr:MAG: hypothetical protein JSU74_13490 [candidate division Zixibacteria bacterium]
MSLPSAVLLSRQALHPSRRHPWVAKSIDAVKYLKQHNHRLCSSTNVQTWEMLTALGSLYGLELEIHLPCHDEQQFQALSSDAVEQFDLNPRETQFVPVLADPAKTTRKDLWLGRDKSIIERADIILPVSVRAGGKMESMIKEAGNNGKTVCRDFAAPYRYRKSPLSYRITGRKLNPQLRELGRTYLIHWTRTFNSAWPTEKLLDFYRAIVESDTYPRTACGSLRNIVSMQLIKATSKHMPENTPTVSFSNRPPAEMTSLIAWRSRYRMMSFEPYGIGIEKGLARQMNIMPVVYYDKAQPSVSKCNVRTPGWLTQSRGEKTDWSLEDEYRHLGDLNLSSISKDRLILICRTSPEAEAIANLSGVTAVPFTVD